MDHAAFAQDALNALSSLSDQPSLDDQFDELNASMLALLDSHAPCMTRTITVRENSEWMNDDILAAKREKRRYERLWRSTKLEVHLTAYKEKRNQLTSLIQKAKVQHEEAKIEACGNDQKALFRH